MQPYEQNRTAWGTTATRTQVEVDQGLRAFMLGVYNHMVLGLGVTGLVALGTYMLATTTGVNGRVALTPFGQAIYVSPLKWLVILAPLAFVFFMSFRMEQMASATARTVFLVFAAVMGLSMSSIFVVFTGQSITQVFFITAAAFGALSLYGYTTKRSLSVIGVLVFAGLTAWDTQRLKEMYVYGNMDGEMASKASIFGALSLYLNFINMFQMLLSLFGNRNE